MSMIHSKKEISDIENILSYSFSEKKLLSAALTHASFYDGKPEPDMYYERLEFLGDAVLELVISEILFHKFSKNKEGELTKMRARLVCEEALSFASSALGLPQYIKMSLGMKYSGGQDNAALTADIMEAVIGAVYLDGGYLSARELINRLYGILIQNSFDICDQDYKSRLQEIVQKDHIGTLSYNVIGESGPDHNKTFEIQILLNDNEIGRGTGKSKLQAGQNAAKQAINSLLQKVE